MPDNLFETIKKLTQPRVSTPTYFDVAVPIYKSALRDLLKHKDLSNALFGVKLALIFPIMKQIKILDNVGLKTWFILCFILTEKQSKNKGVPKIQSLKQNFPELFKLLISSGYTTDELLKLWIDAKNLHN